MMVAVCLLVGGVAEAKDRVVIVAPTCAELPGGDTTNKLQDLLEKSRSVAVRHLNRQRYDVDAPEGEETDQIEQAQACEEDACITDFMEDAMANFAIGGRISRIDNQYILTWRLWRRDQSSELYRAVAIASVEQSYNQPSYRQLKRTLVQATYQLVTKLNQLETSRRRKMYSSFVGAAATAALGVWAFLETRSDLAGLRQQYVDATTEQETIAARQTLEEAVQRHNIGNFSAIGLGLSGGALAYLGVVLSQE